MQELGQYKLPLAMMDIQSIEFYGYCYVFEIFNICTGACFTYSGLSSQEKHTKIT